jgi:hypothetical protein
MIKAANEQIGVFEPSENQKPLPSLSADRTNSVKIQEITSFPRSSSVLHQILPQEHARYLYRLGNGTPERIELAWLGTLQVDDSNTRPRLLG